MVTPGLTFRGTAKYSSKMTILFYMEIKALGHMVTLG